LQHTPGTRHSRSRRSKTPPVAGSLLPAKLEGLLVHRQMLYRHVSLSPPSPSIWLSASSLSPAQSPVRAMGFSQPAAAVFTTADVPLFQPRAIRDVGKLVSLIHLYAASRGWPQKMPSPSRVRSSLTASSDRAIAAKTNTSCSAVRTEVQRTGLPVKSRLSVMLRSRSSVLNE